MESGDRQGQGSRILQTKQLPDEPRPERGLPREILLMEEGAEAFQCAGEAVEPKADPYERTTRRRDHANGFKDKTVATRVGRLKLKIPQVRHLSFYPKSLERGCRSEKALKLAIRDVLKGVSTHQITEQATQVFAKLLDEESVPGTGARVVYLDAHREGARPRQHRTYPETLESIVREWSVKRRSTGGSSCRGCSGGD